MADHKNTPTKKYRRDAPLNQVQLKVSCSLCGDVKNRLQKIFSKNGQSKDLELKIKRCCGGIVIDRDDTDALICIPCVTLINKIDKSLNKWREFYNQKKASQVQKRCLKNDSLSPSRSRFPKKLKFGATDQEINFSEKENLLFSIHLADFEISCPSESAMFILKSCPNIMQSLRNEITSGLKEKVSSLCKRTNGSILHEKSYDSMAEIDFESTFEEFVISFPFVVEILKAMMNQEIVDNELKPKFGMIYSIIMSIRWHELSYFRRVITVLLIEGGCSKMVSFL